MRIKPLHNNFIMPKKSTQGAGAFDIFMPENGCADRTTSLYGLGFSAAVPSGYVALIFPRSGVGAKHGVELTNTCGVIDSDYRGEWKAAIRTKNGLPYFWVTGDRVLQFLVVPVADVQLQLVEELDVTERSPEGFGSSGK